jgi:cytochrome b
MQSAPAFQPAAAGARPLPARGRLVTDAPTRMFHWLFALSFVGAYLTADGERWRALHVTLGYTLAGLLALRVLYGLFGPRQARLAPLFRRLGGAASWWRQATQALGQGAWQRVNARQGVNLVMALALASLLVLAVPLTLSGYGTYAEWGDVLGGDWLEELHEFLGEALLAVALAHVALIAGLSLQRRRNQALPMLTGRVDGAGPDLVQHNRAWLAALLLAAAAAFIAWQWQQSPNGLVPAQGIAASLSGHHEDDDD